MAGDQNVRHKASPGRTDGLASPSQVDNQGIVVPAALILLVLAPLNFSLGGVVLNPPRLLLLVLFVPMCVSVFSGRVGRILPTDILFFVFSGLSVLSVAVNNGFVMGVQFGGSTTVDFLGGYLVGRVFITNANQFLKFSKLLAFLIVIILPFAIVEAVSGTNLVVTFYNKLPLFQDIAFVDAGARLGLERVQFVFSTPIHYGLFACTLFSFIFYSYLRDGNIAAAFFLGGLVSLAGFVSLSSGAFLALLVQIGLIIWGSVFRENKKKWSLLVWIVVSTFIFLELASDRGAVKVFIGYAAFSLASAYNRIMIFEYGMQNVASNPVFGIGLNDWARPAWMIKASVDNYWLLAAMRHGIPAFLTLVLGWATLFYQVFRRKEGSRDFLIVRRAWLLYFIGVAVSLCTVHIWGVAMSFVYLYLGMGAWLAAQNEVLSTDDRAVEAQPNDGRTKIRYSRY